MADIIISRKVRLCPGLSIAETISSSSDVIETVNFNPAESISLGSAILEADFIPTESISLGSAILEADFIPTESMTYTN